MSEFIELACAKHSRPPEYRIQRGAQFVRDYGQELILGPACLLGLLVKPGVVHGYCGLRSKPFDNPCVTLLKNGRVRVPQEKPAYDLARTRDDGDGQVTGH